MTDHYIAGLEAKVHEQRQAIAKLEGDNAELHQVVGRQSTRLEQQARTLTAVREVTAVYSKPGMSTMGPALLRDLKKALDGATHA